MVYSCAALLCWLWFCWATPLGAAPARYLAVLADGTRVEGNTISDWAQPNQSPRLESTSLADPQRPLRWLRDRTVAQWQPTADLPGVVEFFGGDRLPGRVTGWEPLSAIAGGAGPSYLLVQPSIDVRHPEASKHTEVRVLPDFVRRVVWDGPPRQPFTPGTLFCKDGRRLGFRTLRWEKQSVRILTDEGLQRFDFAQLAEVHMPQADLWGGYFAQLAVLAPELNCRLMRFDCGNGLVVTACASRFRPTADGNPSDPARWLHIVQPAWSLDPLWVRFSTIAARWEFPPEEVPLSYIEPASVVQQSVFGAGLTAQLDRNVHGGSLFSGNRQFAWGWGVQASSQLWFDLPACARGFQTRIGLDRTAGDGGCARARIYLDRPQGKPLYESKLLIGSAEVVDTGILPVNGAKSLILAADSAEKETPPSADPLDIRDAVNWLEPVVLLDREKLLAEVQRLSGKAMLGLEGWKLSAQDGRPLAPRLFWEESNPRLLRCVLVPPTDKGPVRLTAERQLTAADNFLLVHLRAPIQGVPPGKLEVYIDGAAVARVDPLPADGRLWPMLVPLSQHQGKPVRIELVHTPVNEQSRLEWLALSFISRPTRVNWITLKPQWIRAACGSQLKVLADGSLLAEGTSPPWEIYTVAGQCDLPKITAIRLEALYDRALPGNGPGRSGGEGNFVLSQVSVHTIAGPSPATLPGRFVRVERPEAKDAILALAEVQVFSGQKNVALAGKATQSSTSQNAAASRAIDGNVDGNMDHGSVSHTGSKDSPWWEVELAETAPIERIVLWNRTDKKHHTRLTDFRVSLLDDQRKSLWERRHSEPPLPCAEFWIEQVEEVRLASAVANSARKDFPAESALGNSDLLTTGWSMERTGQPGVLVLVLEEPIDPRGKTLVVTLKHVFQWHQWTLGRWRLSVTAEPPPIPPEPTAVELLAP